MKRVLKIISGMIFLISCADSPEEKRFSYEDKYISPDTLTKTSCPYLTSDINGNPVLSWVKELNDSMAIMCYSVSNDNGNSFSSAMEIPASCNIHPHGENIPKILFKPDGEVIAMWGVNNSNPKSKYSGLVYYSQSLDKGKTWGKAIALVKDTSAYDQRYFDLELLPDGEAMVIWLDNRGDKSLEGSTLFCATTEGKNGFQNEKAIGVTCCPCCRTDLFIDDKGSIHASYRDIINDSIRDMVQIVSADRGKSFSLPVRISADNWVVNGCPHTGPAETQNRSGMHFAWYTMGGGEGVFYCNSKDLGKTFSKREIVSGDPSAKHPQITCLPDGKILIVWDQMIKKDENFIAQIGLQVRDEEGKILSTGFISSEYSLAEFPQVRPINNSNALVAYKEKNEKGYRVVYKIVSIDETIN